MIEGRATPEGTAQYAVAHGGTYRDVGGLRLSTLGMGSYLGATDGAARAAYQESALHCLQHGVNVLDTAANYRDQASERDLGAAFRQYVDGGGERAHFLVSTKAGFLHGDCDSPLGKEWFQQEYVLDGTVTGRDIAANVHCMKPDYLRREMARSRHNLGLEAVDVQFLHNPEAWLQSGVEEEVFYAAVEEAFVAFEEAVDAGHARVYGIATWDGLRAPPGHPARIRLNKVVHAAGAARMRVGGKASEHHFRAVQLPVNLAMTEAHLSPNQPWKFGDHTTLQAARELALFTMASASLMQAKLQGRVPAEWKQALGTEDDLETAFQFTRSVPGVHTALVGLGRPEHAKTAIAWAKARAPDPKTVALMLGPGGPHG